MLKKLRPYLTKILNPFAKRITIHPNILTLISPFIALASALFFANGYLLGGAITILLSGLFDVLDGAVARYHNKNSEFGAFLDSTIDRFSDAIIIIGIIFGGYCSWFVGILAIHSAITVSYVRARAESKGIPCNVGIAERAVRLILIVLGAIIGYYYNVSGYLLGTYYPNLYFGIIILILIVLSYFTVFQRVYHVYKHSKKEGERFKKRPITLSKEEKPSKNINRKTSKNPKTKENKFTKKYKTKEENPKTKENKFTKKYKTKEENPKTKEEKASKNIENGKFTSSKEELQYNRENHDLEESDINIIKIDEDINSIKLEDDWDVFNKVDENKLNKEKTPKKASKKIIRRKKKKTKTLKKE